MSGAVFYHGSRALFDKFDLAYVGTGEGVDDVRGFRFSRSRSGAIRHARRVLHRLPGAPLVYTCEIEGPIVRKGVAPAMQGTRIKTLFSNMPLLYGAEVDNRSWFWAFGCGEFQQASEAVAVEQARRLGIAAIDDWEGAWAEPYHQGPTLLALEPDMIRIISVEPAID